MIPLYFCGSCGILHGRTIEKQCTNCGYTAVENAPITGYFTELNMENLLECFDKGEN